MPIGGLVELLSARRIDGWALDTEKAQAPVLDLCIEGEKIKRIKALRRRAGFENLVPLGSVGFRFKLHSSLMAYVRDPSAVTLELNGVTLPILDNRLTLLPEESRKDPKEIRPLLENGYVITKQGELRLSIRLDKEWQELHFSFYEEARRKFRELFGYELYLVYGGLLGLTREGQLIASDDDLDVSYLSRHTNPQLVKEEMVEIHKTLRKVGENSNIATSRRNFLRWQQTQSDALMDVFPSWITGEHYFLSAGVGAQNCAPLIREGFKTKIWYGHEVCIPVASEKILEATYGPGWRVPDPLFQWIVPRFARLGIRKITLTKEEVAELNTYVPAN